MIPQNKYKAYQHIYRHNKISRIRYWFYGVFLLLTIVLFMPWTQNIRARGFVTTLKQEHRPQQLNTIIPGRIVKWNVKEGDLVKKGDTLILLAEIKDSYLDPELIGRTQEQLNARQLAVINFKGKANATGDQITALTTGRDLKLQQLENKIQQLLLSVQSDSMETIAAENEFAIASKQFTRQKALFDSGLVSLTQLEQRNQAYQNAFAKKISAENKLANTRQDLTIARIEMSGIRQEFSEKVSKAQGDQYQSLSQIATEQAEIAKLENAYSNFHIRSGMYYITAPQDGQVIKAKKAGIGEVVKEGEMLVEIVPDKIQFAVEIFIRPVDLPLVKAGQDVRLIFDGYPTIVFSGWPNASYGLFSGKVVAVENAVSSNGKFRMLIAENPSGKPWPEQLKIGAGVNSINLLKTVPVWYEIWRNINGFPPDYYTISPKDQAQK